MVDNEKIKRLNEEMIQKLNLLLDISQKIVETDTGAKVTQEKSLIDAGAELTNPYSYTSSSKNQEEQARLFGELKLEVNSLTDICREQVRSGSWLVTDSKETDRRNLLSKIHDIVNKDKALLQRLEQEETVLREIETLKTSIEGISVDSTIEPHIKFNDGRDSQLTKAQASNSSDPVALKASLTVLQGVFSNLKTLYNGKQPVEVKGESDGMSVDHVVDEIINRFRTGHHTLGDISTIVNDYFDHEIKTGASPTGAPIVRDASNLPAADPSIFYEYYSRSGNRTKVIIVDEWGGSGTPDSTIRLNNWISDGKVQIKPVDPPGSWVTHIEYSILKPWT